MKANVMEGMEYMDQKYIDEAVEYKAKTRNVKPLMRWGAIAACLVLVVSLCLGYFVKDEVVLPPTRVGENANGKASITDFTFKEACASADVIAWVRIGNWLGEKTGDEVLDTTYFEAEVVESYKGDPAQTIILEQLGSSKWTLKGYPLFTSGNELLLFLVGGENRYNGDTYSYYINGSYGTVMDVVTNTDGTVYAADRMGMVTEAIKDSIVNEQLNYGLRMELSEALKNVDAYQQKSVAGAAYVFRMDVMEELLCKNLDIGG